MRMKGGFRGAVFAVFTMMLISGIAGSSSAAIVEEDYCWNIKITKDVFGAVNPPIIKLVKFHITPLGNGATLAMTGQVNVAGDNPLYLMGIATVGSTSIIANLTTSQIHTDNWRDTGVLRVTLSRTTLNGAFYEVGNDFQQASLTPGIHFASGVLTSRTCP